MHGRLRSTLTPSHAPRDPRAFQTRVSPPHASRSHECARRSVDAARRPAHARGRLNAAGCVLLLAFTAACSGQATNPPPPPSGPGGDITVVGTERLGWDQDIASDPDLRNYSFAVYVDDVRALMSDASCTPRLANPNTAACSAALPAMQPGRHVLRISALLRRAGTVAESEKSAPLTVTMLGSEASAASSGATAHVPNPERRGALQVQVLSRDVHDVADVAVSPDGDVFVAERRGTVRIFRRGAFLEEPALSLSDVMTGAEGHGLLSLALHPDFSNERRIYFVYTAPTRDGAVYRIASGREVGGRIGELMTLLDAGPAPEGGSAIVRTGRDGKLYVALTDVTAASGSESRSRILRVNEDGTTPADSPRFSPVLTRVGGIVYGLEWRGVDGALYATASANGPGELRRVGAPDGVPGATIAAWPGAEVPTRLAWYGGSAIAPFAGRMLVGMRDGGLQAVDVTEAARGPFAPRVAREVGAVSAIAVARDGSVYLGTANRRQISAAESRSKPDFLVRIASRQSRGPR